MKMMFCKVFIVSIFYINNIYAELFPIRVAYDELLLPNEWTSVKDCPVRYYDTGREGVAAPVAGQEAYEREFAHMAAIGWTDDDGKIEWNCGGSLISENFIITAGHCISWQGKAPDVVRMGDLNLESDADDKYAQQLSIEKVIPHPLYTSRYTYNDIALLKLNGSIKVHDTVCPACLWTNSTVRFEFLEACGYGQIGFFDKKTPKLLKVTLSPVNFTECDEYYPIDRRLNEGLKDHQMCAADRARIQDTCLGDSGGPLQIKLLGNGKMNPFLIGVTSFGKSCGTDAPGVYTRISSYVDWIESVTKIDTDPRRCAFKYAKYREYEPDVIKSKDSNMEWIDYTKFHIDVSAKRIDYLMQIGWKQGGSNVDWACSGILITETFVLTLASCLKMNGKTPDKVMTRDNSESDVKSVTLHPNFVDGRIDNDIALLELVSNIKFNDDVRPACLYGRAEFPKNQELGLLGWGLPQNLGDLYGNNVYDENEKKKLVISRSKPINFTYCNQFYQNDGIRIDEETKLCYGNTDYYLVPDTCQIAMGAPLERELDMTDHYHSFIMGLPVLANDCGFGFPAVATKVSKYIDWIDSVIFPDKIPTANHCALPSGQLSTCKRASDCPQLVQDVKSGRVKLMDFICKFDDHRNPLVCCPNNSENINRQKLEKCPETYRQFRRPMGEYFYDTSNNDEFAHLALIGYGATREWHCRGNLISDRHVLTSYECVNDGSNYDSVALGNVNGVLYKINKITTNKQSFTLITLDDVVRFSKNIVPICLWQDKDGIPFSSLSIVSKINNPLITSRVRPYQTSECRAKPIASSINSDDQSCLSFFRPSETLCTSSGTAVHAIRNETGLIVPYLVGELFDVEKVKCDADKEDVFYAFTRTASHIDWIIENM